MEHDTPQAIPRFPSALARTLRYLPLMPVSVALTRLTQSMAKRHEAMFRRLGAHADATFLLNPTDLPVTLCLEPRSGRPKVTLYRTPPIADARIAGPLAALIGLVHGAYDGDALFFSRDLVIEGDTAAALALRNAVDDAELDMAAEIEAFSGPFARPLHKLIDIAERRTGVALTRHEEDLLW
ncbi:SCP2 sterol-binding domain-containing protein [uncultured Shimia sp.]|uniref:ubiquinone anaerobic biosynthesis accessory factor UbiT n=1 Tax=uncultured Shimia sp. TaxID=573152 RepID=UPI002616EACB|nr:SCP2 sterol-binding domain-containing protein [uncultured Shimia sp.]